MQRYGSVIKLKPDKVEEYKRLHVAVWPDVARLIKEGNIRNYSIFLRKLPDGNHYLFSYLEYVGGDIAADSARIAADPVTQRWWAACKPCHEPFPDRAKDEWWASMEEVFHQD
jgi:L-rhamnose mutarotase